LGHQNARHRTYRDDAIRGAHIRGGTSGGEDSDLSEPQKYGGDTTDRGGPKQRRENPHTGE